MQPRQHPSNQEIKQLINAKRNRKKADLTKQFEDFKQRIQQFEEKNDQIIGRIREAYTQKKRAIQRNSPSASPLPQHLQAPPPRVVYYDSINDQESVESSVEYSKNAVYEGNGVQHLHKTPRKDPHITGASGRVSPISTPHQVYTQPSDVLNQYVRMPNNSVGPIRTQESDTMPPVYSARLTQGFSRSKSTISLEKYHQMQLRNQQLSEELEAKSKELARMRTVEGKFKSYSKQIKNIIENELESYHEEFISERMAYMERYIRKCEQRLSRLNLRLRDADEEKRSRRTLKRSRERRRSHSRLTINDSVDAKDTSIVGRAPPEPPNRFSRVSSQQRHKDKAVKQQEFQQIASGYESIIRGKEEEIGQLQKQVRGESVARQGMKAELQKLRRALQKKQMEISELNIQVQAFSATKKEEGSESRTLKEALQRMRDEVSRKDRKEQQMQETINRLEKSKRQMREEHAESLSKVKSASNQTVSQLKSSLKESEVQHEQQLEQLKQRIQGYEKQITDKECEALLTSNRIKKLEVELRVSEEKIKELQSILLKDEHREIDKSVSLDQSMHPSAEMRALQANIKALDDELELKSGQVYRLERQLQAAKESQMRLQKEVGSSNSQKQALEERVREIEAESRSAQKEGREKDKQYQKEQQRILTQLQGERDGLLSEKEALIQNNSRMFEELKALKENNLKTRRELIKTNSQLTFMQQQSQSFEQKLTQAKSELSQTRNQFHKEIQQLRESQGKLREDLKQKEAELQHLKVQIATDQMMFSKQLEEKDEDQLMNSCHVSQISFNFPKRLQEDAQLRERLKEAEEALQMKNEMEEQIRREYKTNLQRIRVQAAEKLAKMESMETQLREMRRERATGKVVEMDESLEAYKKELYEGTIIKLQEQVGQLQEERDALQLSEKRANQLLHQFMDKIKKQTDNEKEDLRRELEQKTKIITELKQIIELRQLKLDSKTTSKESPLFEHNSGLQDHSQFDQAEMSMLSNISDVFKRDDLLQQRIRKGRSSREEQVKLFEKTSAYIKSLKGVIDLKDSHIKVLEEQLRKKKQRENIGKSVGAFNEVWENKYRTDTSEYEVELDEGPFKDYDSVQLEGRRTKMYTWGKQLQHEKNLSIEENKMLVKQIEMLQDELMRAEEQENSLVRIKDLYKDEIRKVLEKNQQQTKQFHQQIQQLRNDLDNSESYHNWQAIKQLVVKMIGTIGRLQDDPRNVRREDCRRELQEYVKVMSSILAFDVDTRDRLLATLRR